MLCKNCHGLFDAGAYVFDEELKMEVRSLTLRGTRPWSARHGVFQLNFHHVKGAVAPLHCRVWIRVVASVCLCGR